MVAAAPLVIDPASTAESGAAEALVRLNAPGHLARGDRAERVENTGHVPQNPQQLQHGVGRLDILAPTWLVSHSSN